MFLTDVVTNKFDVRVGSQVSIPSLFTKFSGTQQIQPITRTGRLALAPKEKIRAEVGPITTGEIDGFLIECLSWGGCSGAPVFVQHATQHDDKAYLLGLISGHYDMIKTALDEESKEWRVPTNAGIALVVPAQAIYDLIMLDEVIKEREEACTLNFIKNP